MNRRKKVARCGEYRSGNALALRQVLLLCLALLFSSPATAATNECVVLLHGLARTSASMEDLKDSLEAQGYLVANVDYPSRRHTIEELATMAVPEGLARCESLSASHIHFVTHSLGGILVRQYLSLNGLPALGRVVMLAPPNQGSEVVDTFGDLPGYDLLNGPAGAQLGTGDASVPLKLGPVTFDVGVIAGTRSINMVLSQALPNPDDGKVSVYSTRVKGMCGFLALPVSHPFIMQDDQVIDQVLAYLRAGEFTHSAAEPLVCDFRS